MPSKLHTTIPLHALFPDCVLPDCERQGAHQHILPKQQQVLDSTAELLYHQGGVGSAKSLAHAVKAVWLSLTVENNVGVVVRKDYKLLYKSSWRDIKAVLGRVLQKGWLSPEMTRDEQHTWAIKHMYKDKRQGDYTTINLPNGSVIYAMQGKSWEEGLGASYGWFWVDDAMESTEEMFVGNEISAGLLSRLRLPHVRYHAESNGSVNRLHGMVSSNPPPQGHWLHKLFGSQPGVSKLGNYTVEWLQSATTENPFVGADYAIGLLAAQKQMGRGQNVARRIIFGESIPAYGGVRVFPQFQHERHVGVVKYDPAVPVVVGWDFGYHHPAVVCAHLFKCEAHENHYFALSEVAECFSATVYQFWLDYVQPHIHAYGYNAGMVLHAGDKAGWRASSSNRDRRGDMKILKDEYGLPFRFKHLDLANSLQYMRYLLDPRKICACGQEYVRIDPTGCPVLIAALEGGYKYGKARDGKVTEKPIEDRYFADVACAWRYGAENYVKFGIPWDLLHPSVPEPVEQHFSGYGSDVPPWKWMEMTDAEMAKMIH